MKLDTGKPSHAECQAVLVLEPSEFAFDGCTSTVEPLPFIRAVGNRIERNRAALPETHDRDAASYAGLVHHPVVVVALVHRTGRGPVATGAHRVEQRRDIQRLIPARGLDLPSEREARPGADSGVDLVAVEPAALTGRDGRPMPPGGVRVAVGLTLRAMVVEVPLTVRPSRKVGRVNGYVLAHPGNLRAERRGERVQACGKSRPIVTELRGEAVAGPMTRPRAERGGEAVVLRDQVNGARPRRERIDGFHEARSEKSTSAVTTATRPTQSVKLADEGRNLGRVEECADLSGAGRYPAGCHASYTSCGQAPGSLRFAGALFYRICRTNYSLAIGRHGLWRCARAQGGSPPIRSTCAGLSPRVGRRPPCKVELKLSNLHSYRPEVRVGATRIERAWGASPAGFQVRCVYRFRHAPTPTSGRLPVCRADLLAISGDIGITAGMDDRTGPVDKRFPQAVDAYLQEQRTDVRVLGVLYTANSPSCSMAIHRKFPNEGSAPSVNFRSLSTGVLKRLA